MKSMNNLNLRLLTASVGVLLLFCAIATSSKFPTSAKAGDTFPLTVTLTGDAFPGVHSSPEGIDCGLTCDANFPVGSKVTLTPNQLGKYSSSFSGWGGDCAGQGYTCTLVMNSAKSVLAEGEVVSIPPVENPQISPPVVNPSTKKVKRGGSVRFKVKMANESDGHLRDLALCLKVPKKLVRVQGKSCREITDIMPGDEKFRNFRVKVKPKGSARRIAKLRFVLTDYKYPRVVEDSETTAARLKIRRSAGVRR